MPQNIPQSFLIPGLQKPVSRRSKRLIRMTVVLLLAGGAFPCAKSEAADSAKAHKPVAAAMATSATALSDASLDAITRTGIRLSGTQAFSSRQLRGFCTVKGEAYLWEREGARGSLLSVACDNEEKAGLLQAKYLSDISVLPGVEDQRRKLADQDVLVKVVKAQGSILALRSGACVQIFAARLRCLFIPTTRST